MKIFFQNQQIKLESSAHIGLFSPASSYYYKCQQATDVKRLALLSYVNDTLDDIITTGAKYSTNLKNAVFLEAIYLKLSNLQKRSGSISAIKVIDRDVLETAPGFVITIYLNEHEVISYVLTSNLLLTNDKNADILKGVRFTVSQDSKLTPNYIYAPSFLKVLPVYGEKFLTPDLEFSETVDTNFSIATINNSGNSFITDVNTLSFSLRGDNFQFILDEILRKLCIYVTELVNLDTITLNKDLSDISYNEVKEYARLLHESNNLTKEVSLVKNLSSSNHVMPNAVILEDDIAYKFPIAGFFRKRADETFEFVGVCLTDSTSSLVDLSLKLSNLITFRSQLPGYELKQNTSSALAFSLVEDIQLIENQINLLNGVCPLTTEEIKKMIELQLSNSEDLAELISLQVSYDINQIERKAASDFLDVMSSVDIYSPIFKTKALFCSIGYSIGLTQEEMLDGKGYVIYNPALRSLLPNLKHSTRVFKIDVSSPKTCDQANVETQIFERDVCVLTELNDQIATAYSSMMSCSDTLLKAMAYVRQRIETKLSTISAQLSKQAEYDSAIVKISEYYFILAQLKAYSNLVKGSQQHSIREVENENVTEIMGYTPKDVLAQSVLNIDTSRDFASLLSRLNSINLNYGQWTAIRLQEAINSYKNFSAVSCTFDYNRDLSYHKTVEILSFETAECKKRILSWWDGGVLGDISDAQLRDYYENATFLIAQSMPRVWCQGGKGSGGNYYDINNRAYSRTTLKQCVNTMLTNVKNNTPRDTISIPRYSVSLTNTEVEKLIKSLPRNDKKKAQQLIRTYIKDKFLESGFFRQLNNEFLSKRNKELETNFQLLLETHVSVHNCPDYESKSTGGYSGHKDHEDLNSWTANHYIKTLEEIGAVTTSFPNYNDAWRRRFDEFFIVPRVDISGSTSHDNLIPRAFVGSRFSSHHQTYPAMHAAFSLPLPDGTELDDTGGGARVITDTIPMKLKISYTSTEDIPFCQDSDSFDRNIIFYTEIKSKFDTMVQSILLQYERYASWFSSLNENQIDNDLMSVTIQSKDYNRLNSLNMVDNYLVYEEDPFVVIISNASRPSVSATQWTINDDLKIKWSIKHDRLAECLQKFTADDVLYGNIATLGGQLPFRNLQRAKILTKREVLAWVGTYLGVSDPESIIISLGGEVSRIVSNLDETSSSKMDFPVNSAAAFESFFGYSEQNISKVGINEFMNIFIPNVNSLQHASKYNTLVENIVEVMNTNDLEIITRQNFNYYQKIENVSDIDTLRQKLVDLDKVLTALTVLQYDQLSNTFVREENKKFSTLAIKRHVEQSTGKTVVDAYLTLEQLVYIALITFAHECRNQGATIYRGDRFSIMRGTGINTFLIFLH